MPSPTNSVKEKTTTTLKICGLEWEHEDQKGEDNALQIRCYALTPENETITLRYETYRPFIYFELPKKGEGTGGRDKWTKLDAYDLHESLQKKLGNNGKYLVDFKSSDFVNHSLLFYYGFRSDFVRFNFTNLEAMRHATNLIRENGRCKGLWLDGENVKGRVLLGEIDCVVKLLVDSDITHTCWYTVEAERITTERNKISNCDKEYYADWRTIKKAVHEVPIKPKFLSYDIEVYSKNHKRFPMEHKASDVCFMIGCVFFRPGEERKRYCIIMGDCAYRPKKGKDYEIIRVKTEKELIYKFCELLQSEKVDIVTGYNVAQFDNSRLDARLKVCNAKWPVIGRLKHREGLVKNIVWRSDAYGEKNIAKLYMPGRFVMDYFEETRRSQKWDSYTLDNAAKEILNDKKKQKHDISPEQMFIAYEDMKRYHKTCGKDCDNKCELCAKRTKALKKMGRVANYCIQDCELVVDMIEKTNWDIASVEMSNVVNVTMRELFDSGQQKRCLNLLYRESFKDKNNRIILDVRPADNFYYEGGKVQDPVQGLHRLVLTLDFASLYPNIMIRHNLGHDTLIHPRDHGKYTEDQVQIAKVMTSRTMLEGEELEDKVIKNLEKSERTFMFINREIYKGLTPRILEGLLAKRAEVRGHQKKFKEDIDLMWTILEKRQLAYKVSANSMYGFYGVRVGGKRPCLEVAATVTYFGRKSITHVINTILEKYPGCKLIYGDTDSCMVQLPGTTVENAWAKSRELATFASSLFPPPLKMEPEWPSDMLAIKMKHYAKMKIDDKTNDYYRNEDGTRKIEIKGLMPTRRDTCQWAKDVCLGIITLMMEEFGYYACVAYLAEKVLELYEGNADVNDLVISKKMGSNYENDNATMKVFGDEMIKLGKTIEPGERCKYVVLDRPGKTRIGEKMMRLDIFQSGDCEDGIDFGYYYVNLLMKKVDIIMNSEYRKWNDELDDMKLKIKGHTTTAAKPAKMIERLAHLSRGDAELRRVKIESFAKKVGKNYGHVGMP